MDRDEYDCEKCHAYVEDACRAAAKRNPGKEVFTFECDWCGLLMVAEKRSYEDEYDVYTHPSVAWLDSPRPKKFKF
jgi:transcription elongation factor Elf1